MHEEFEDIENLYKHDFALIMFEKELTLTKNVMAICLDRLNRVINVDNISSAVVSIELKFCGGQNGSQISNVLGDWLGFYEPTR